MAAGPPLPRPCQAASVTSCRPLFIRTDKQEDRLHLGEKEHERLQVPGPQEPAGLQDVAGIPLYDSIPLTFSLSRSFWENPNPSAGSSRLRGDS